MDFERASDVPDGTTMATDVCVIGSGAAGLTVAHQLTRTNLEVLVLEAGGLEQDHATEADCFAIEHDGVPYGSDNPTRGRWFGGSTNLWFGRIAMIDPIDVESRAWVRYSGWPLSYEEITRWTDRAAEVLAVPHFDKISISNWPANATIETFAGQPGAGLGVFLWADGMYMGSHLRETLRAARNVRVLLDATATELVASDSGTGIEAVTVRGSRGNTFRVQAKRVVVAAGGLENPRLLLASTSHSPNGLGNGEDLVGRFYMDHPRGEGLASVDLRHLTREQLDRVSLLGEKAHSDYGKVQLRLTFSPELQRRDGLLNHSLHAHLVSDFHESDAFHAARRVATRVRRRGAAGDSGLGADVGAVLRNASALARFGAQKMLGSPRLTKLIVIDQMEQEPDPESRLTLDLAKRDRFGMPRVRLDWRIGESTYRSQVRMHELFRDALARVGIGGLESDVLDGQGHPTLIEMKHPSGTTRMGATSRTGVVDADCRVHGVGNLYVVGSSVFPTVGHFNPTLLIVALAARLADHLRLAA